MTTAIWNSDSPALRETFVCYADILGFRNRMERAFEADAGTSFLKVIKRSLTAAYKEVRQVKDLLVVCGETCDMKVFTDNIVVAYTAQHLEITFGERELLTFLNLFARLQAVLTSDGFLLRGAISFGQHYQDDDIAYGPALLEAVDLDKSGRPPRLVIAPSIKPWIVRQLSSHDHVQWAPQYKALLEDPCDGRIFVNYLDLAFEIYGDSSVTDALLEAHRKTVVRGLKEHESNEGVRWKYEWLATYHNYVCRAFAKRFPMTSHEDADPEYMALCAFAQRALDYLVPCEHPDLSPPRPLNLQDLAAEDLADDIHHHQGRCLHCRQAVTANGGVAWRRTLCGPCPHCGRPGWCEAPRGQAKSRVQGSG